MPKQVVAGEMVSCLVSSAFLVPNYFRCLMFGHRLCQCSGKCRTTERRFSSTLEQQLGIHKGSLIRPIGILIALYENEHSFEGRL